MADDRPAQIGQVLHGFPFAEGFLRLVFTQQAATRRVGQAQTGLGLGLAHRQQSHPSRVAPRTVAGGIHAGPHRRQVVPEIFDGSCLRIAAMLAVAGLGGRGGQHWPGSFSLLMIMGSAAGAAVVGRPRRGSVPLSTAWAARPTTRPQNAPPMPSSVILAAAARKVISDASRVFTSARAVAKLPPMVPSSAGPASVVMKVAGKTMKPPASVTPNTPTRM